MYNKIFYTDIVLIHTYKRVNFIYYQVKSLIDSQFLNSCYCGVKHIVLFLIIDDSPESMSQSFLQEVEKIKKYILNKKLNKVCFIDCWNKTRQVNLLKKFSLEKYDNLFIDSYSGRVGGSRGIQNISQIIADYIIGNRENQEVLEHKIDDDMFAFYLKHENNALKFTRLDNFFCRKRKKLSQSKVRIVGSYATLDSGSPVTDLFEATEAVDKILECISIDDIGSNLFQWQCIKKKSLYLYGVPNKVIDETKEIIGTDFGKFLNITIPNKTQYLNEIMCWVTMATNLLSRGINRFEYNLSNFCESIDWTQEHSQLPGGCVSFCNSEKIGPHPNFGTQDILWSYLENARHGGGLYGDVPLLHVKTPIARSKLQDDLLYGDELKRRRSFALSVKVIKLVRDKFRVLNDTSDDFVNFRGFEKNILDLTQQKILRILDKCEKIEYITKDVSIKNSVNTLKDFFVPLSKNYPLLEAKYVSYTTKTTNHKIEKMVNEWLSGYEEWEEIRAKIRNR
ncbi:MAG: hypothetical protein ABIA91_03415 [Patescibacteria group bacterium]